MTIPYIVFRITNLNRSNRLEKPIQSIPSFKWHSILKKSRAQRKEFKTTDESIYYTGWKSELNLKHNEDALTSASKGSNFPFFFFFFNISPIRWNDFPWKIWLVLVKVFCSFAWTKPTIEFATREIIFRNEINADR